MQTTLLKSSAHNIPIPDKSVHCVVTSPPYWGLRVYDGDQAVEWPEVRYHPLRYCPEIVIPSWRGGLGNEPTPDAYIGHMILCLREWGRVLRGDGTLWVNLGDSYAGSGKGGCPSKNLVGIPHLFAFAAQAVEFILSNTCVWFYCPNSCLRKFFTALLCPMEPVKSLCSAMSSLLRFKHSLASHLIPSLIGLMNVRV